MQWGEEGRESAIAPQVGNSTLTPLLPPPPPLFLVARTSPLCAGACLQRASREPGPVAEGGKRPRPAQCRRRCGPGSPPLFPPLPRSPRPAWSRRCRGAWSQESEKERWNTKKKERKN